MANRTSLWHPNAEKVIIAEAPQSLRFTGGGRKMCWHTTEGRSAGGAFAAYHASGVCPHFTIKVTGGQRELYQHLPINFAASALKHVFTPATNTANVIQVEICGLASESANWPDSMYHYLWLLSKWTEKHFGVPRETPVRWRTPDRLGPQEWVEAAGHVGHMHCPGNDHTDPGKGFHIGRVLNGTAKDRA